MIKQSTNLNPRPSLYYSFEYILESGLLSPERIEEISRELKKRIQPVILQDGTTVPNARIITIYGGERVFVPDVSGDFVFRYTERRVIEGILTDEELQIISKHCSQVRWRNLEKKNFEMAVKIKESDWKGGIFWGDSYYDSITDFHDMVGDDELLESAEDDMPIYLWAAKEKKVVCDSLDICNNFLEHIIEDLGWEDMSIDDLDGVEALKNAFEAFKKENEDKKTFEIDYSTAIVLDISRAAESPNA